MPRTQLHCSQARATRPLLSVRGLTRYGRGGELLLDDITLELHGGERVVIIGPSGAGKTLILRALVELDPLTVAAGNGSGIRFRGELLEDAEVPGFRRQVVYLQQNPVLEDGLVIRSLEAAFALRTTTTAFSPDRAEELLARLGRGPEFLERASDDLSGGESQIVALVRALILDPVVLLLDEPTSALDRETARRAIDLLQAWLEEAAGERAWMWVTHEQALEEKVSDRVIRMADGRLSDDP